MKKSIYTLGIVTVLFITACSNTQTTSVSSSTITSTAPSSSVAEVKEDDYVYIGGKTPYETLTATEEANIKKAEEEARLQAEAKAKAQAEAKAKADAEAKKQAEQQQQAQASQQEVAEQPQQIEEGVYIAGYTKNGNPIYGGENAAEYVHRKVQEQIAALEARGYYGRNKDDVPPEMKQHGSGVVAAE